MGVGEYKLRCCQVILHADCEREIEAWLAIPGICHKRTYCDGNFLNAENAISGSFLAKSILMMETKQIPQNGMN